MSTKHGQGLYPRIVDHYSKNAKTKKTLFTAANIMKNFDIEEKAAKNALYCLHREGRICRHKERGAGGKYRYAIEIDEKYNNPYKPLHEKRASPTAASVSAGHTAIMKTFAVIQNQMARLEDMILTELAEVEKIRKQKNKLAVAVRAIERLDQE